MTKRILAMTLCLALTLLACACAASDVTVSAPESTDNKGGNMPPVSTMEQAGTSVPATQTSSRPALSDTVSKPTEPILPEEKETELEFIKRLSTGEKGIPITMLYESDATYAGLEYPFRFFADEKGNIYYFWHRYFGNLQTGDVLEIPYSTDYFRAFVAYNDAIYALTKSGVLKTYTLKEGLLSSVEIATRSEIDNVSLKIAQDGTIVVRIQDELYNVSGERISRKDEPRLQSNETLLSGGSNIRTIRKTQEKTFSSGSYYLEDMYHQLDSNGNILAAFTTSSSYDGTLYACSVFDEFKNECKWYPGYTVKTGAYAFEGVLFDTIFQGADNNLYFLLLYPDHADLYRIDPGYSDVTFTDLESMADPAEDNSAGSLRSTATTSDTEQHIYLSREAVARRVQYILETEWELTYDHLYDDLNHEEHVVLPGFIEDAVSGNDVTFPITLTGIPYCTGGMNGYETFGPDYTQRSFYENLSLTNSHGNSYRVGNIGKTYDRNGDGYHDMVPYTIGVDCSGFVGSTYGISTKKNVDGMTDYGHIVGSVSQLQPYDFLVDGTAHCYFYVSHNRNGDVATVCDCTSDPDLGSVTQEREISYNRFLSLSRYNPFFEYTITSTGHSGDCTECSGIHAEELHTFSVTYTASTHTSTCKDCDYTATENHTTGYRYNTTRHWVYCRDGCGYESTSSRPHTLQYGACTVCNYNENVLNTRPGTEVILEQ